MSKIFILSHHEVLPVLTSFIDITNIPKQYGGELDFAWCQMPNLDPKIKDLATWDNGYTEFPKGPLRWVTTEDGTQMEAIARGTVDKEERHTRVCTIPVAFSEAAPVPVEALAGEAADTAVVVDSEEDVTDAPETLVQKLSLSEKTAEVEALPNGKTEAA